MRVYFVRHGESKENVNHAHIGATAELTENGRNQARIVAKRFRKIPIDLVFTSTMARAQETAHIISEQINKDVVYSDLFVEVRPPSELLHGKYNIQEKRRIFSNWFALRFTDEHARYSDEENLADLKIRARGALQFIVDCNVNNCLIVTHEMFMRVMLGVVLTADAFSPNLFKCLRDSFLLHNTGVTVFDYIEPLHMEATRQGQRPGHAPGWRLVTWNDHTHINQELNI